MGEGILSGPGGLSRDLLKAFTEAYYPTLKCCILPPCKIVNEKMEGKQDKLGAKKCKFKLEWPDRFFYEIKGRKHVETERRQLKIEDILSVLSDIKESSHFRKNHPDAFCVMALTLEDLFDTNPVSNQAQLLLLLRLATY